MKAVLLPETDVELLRAIGRRFPKVQEMRIFGSRAAGDARRASDIDLAVWADAMTSVEWSDFIETIETAPIIYEIDVIRMDDSVDDGLCDEINRNGASIYTREA